MLNLISLIVAAALVTLQCNIEASAQIDDGKIEVNTKLHRSAAPRRHPHKYVNISSAPPKSVRHTVGTRLVLDCEASGHPAPTIAWYKNGVIVDDYLDESNELIIPDPSSVGRLVSKLVAPGASDGDVYTCVATAGANTQSASTTVYTTKFLNLFPVDEPSKLITLRSLISMPTMPVITSYYEFLLQLEGSTIVLPCRVFSETKSQIYWQDNDDNLIYGNKRMRVFPTGELVLWDLSFADMGKYTCNVKNVYGKDSVSTFIYPYANKH